MKFVCKRYPELLIHDLQVEFHKGQFETDDKQLIGKLKKLDYVKVEEKAEE